MFLAKNSIDVSSATKTILQIEDILNMSLTFNKNKIGLNVDPR